MGLNIPIAIGRPIQRLVIMQDSSMPNFALWFEAVRRRTLVDLVKPKTKRQGVTVQKTDKKILDKVVSQMAYVAQLLDLPRDVFGSRSGELKASMPV